MIAGVGLNARDRLLGGRVCPRLAARWHRSGELVGQSWQVIHDDAPNGVIVNGGVAVHEDVAAPDDLWKIRVLGRGRRADFEFAERFATGFGSGCRWRPIVPSLQSLRNGTVRSRSATVEEPCAPTRGRTSASARDGEAARASSHPCLNDAFCSRRSESGAGVT